ncbi:hypothetical protein FB451DRAFT_1175625 [Mycena latifolia]|nr:hypothetical protein FB451DRAFT_1175625 [Mycena latifolia]
MFQLPQGADKPQGTSDDDPIVLTGDTVEEFRALCWALYALPDEIVRESTPNNSIEKLAQTWSMSSIRGRCNTAHYLLLCSAKMLSALLRLFILYADNPLIIQAQNAWVSRLSDNVSEAIRLQALSAFSDVVDFAETCFLRQFLAQLYYARLKIADNTLLKSATSTSAVFPSSDDLEPKHLLRVLQGVWSLSGYWQRLLAAIPALPSGQQCEHQNGHSSCRTTWNKVWQHAGAQGAAADVLHVAWIYPCRAVRRAGRLSLSAQLEEALADHFLGPKS